MATIVSVRRMSTINTPVTARTSERAYDGSSYSGRGSGSPTGRAPQDRQPSLRLSFDLRPQQGQMITLFLTSNTVSRYQWNIFVHYNEISSWARHLSSRLCVP